MNEQLKLAKKYFIPSPYKGDTQFGTKKTEKKDRMSQTMDSTTLIFSSYHEGQQTTGMFKKNTKNSKPVIFSYHCPGDPTPHLLFMCIKFFQRAD